MTHALKTNLERLSNSKHIAVIGGVDAVAVATEHSSMGYLGKIYPVKSKRKTLSSHPSFKAAEDLPEAHDDVFLAIPREPAIEKVERLRLIGSGGIVSYTAGFKVIGGQCSIAEDALISVCGEMALVGPNCNGVLNYLDRSALWLFAHGGYSPDFGAAIITQSGMLALDFTMSQCSLSLAFIISTGNQAVLYIEDYIFYLCEPEEVRAIGMHVEGISDYHAFKNAAIKAV